MKDNNFTCFFKIPCFLVENIDEVYQSTISEEKVARNAIKFQNAPTTFHSEGRI